MPRYPYTPDSSQILRRHTEIVSPPTPWDNYSDHSLSPVQDALSSCIAHFEELIQSRQPDEDQMEYIVRQFEAMATHLSDSEPYIKETDAQDFALSRHGSGIMQAADREDDLADAKSLYHQAYVAEVGNYVESVQKCINELKKRLDEVKTLNSIQLDVIDDLRKQMKSVRQNMREELERSDGAGNEIQDEDFKITKVVDLNNQENEWSPDADNSSDAKHHDDHSTREFGLDSCQTLVEEEPSSSISQEIQNEYTKLVRSAVYNLTNDDDDGLLTTPRPPIAKRRLITVIRKPPPKPSFWASVGEALDRVAEVLWED
jgi:chromosome segregation ATPase